MVFQRILFKIGLGSHPRASGVMCFRGHVASLSAAKTKIKKDLTGMTCLGAHKISRIYVHVGRYILHASMGTHTVPCLVLSRLVRITTGVCYIVKTRRSGKAVYNLSADRVDENVL